jgi:hypothetical protein|tara:strand:- start:1630 stop:2286 length:657 start_codon:yes stop_codon:yes gene_type:complete
MNIDFDIFEEFENNIFQRFSSIILFVYLYYSLSYYFITDDKINKPHIFFILILLILHLIHIICLKILHKNDLITYSWILAMAPLVVFLLYTKYKERVNLHQKNKEAEMMQKLRNQMNLPDGQPFMRNANPQMPQKQPLQQSGQQNPRQQPIIPQQQPREIKPMVNQLDESRNLENLQQNRNARVNLNQQQNPNQVSERIDQPAELMGMDPYFNGISNF